LGPVYTLENYTGNRPDSLKIKKKKTNTKPGLYQWNNEEWVLKANNIAITDGVFSNDVETERLPFTGRFDGAHIRFGNITGQFKNLLFEKDTLSADVSWAPKKEVVLK
jgi:hypothetical protein